MFRFPKIAEHFAVRDKVRSKGFQTLVLSKPDVEASLMFAQTLTHTHSFDQSRTEARSLSDNERLFQNIIVAVFHICKHLSETVKYRYKGIIHISGKQHQ